MVGINKGRREGRIGKFQPRAGGSQIHLPRGLNLGSFKGRGSEGWKRGGQGGKEQGGKGRKGREENKVKLL